MYNGKSTIRLSESELHNVIKEAVSRVLAEADRHREGYYDDYAERTGKKDRHSPGYYQRYREKKRAEEQSAEQTNGKEKKPVSPKSKKNGKKKSRKAYYHKYNQEHPERLNRGFTKGYVNGNVSDGPEKNEYETDFLGRRILGYDEFGMPITNDPFGDMIRNHEMMPHDDDWCEADGGSGVN